MTRPKISQQVDGISWQTTGIVAAIVIPLMLAAVGYGVLTARVDALGDLIKGSQERTTRTEVTMAQLSIEVAKLGQSVELLARQVGRQDIPSKH